MKHWTGNQAQQLSDGSMKTESVCVRERGDIKLDLKLLMKGEKKTEVAEKGFSINIHGYWLHKLSNSPFVKKKVERYANKDGTRKELPSAVGQF